MPDQVQLRGGTEAENDAFTGVNREVTVDTTNKTLRVHDGTTAGGHKLLVYDEWGRAQVADPVDDADIANKGYVDGQIGDSVASVALSDESGTTYTLALADAGTVKRFTNTAAVTVTVPPNSSVAFVVGSVIEVYAAGAGGVTVVGGSGVTVRLAGTLDRYGTAVLTKHATNEWVMTGAQAVT